MLIELLLLALGAALAFGVLQLRTRLRSGDRANATAPFSLSGAVGGVRAANAFEGGGGGTAGRYAPEEAEKQSVGIELGGGAEQQLAERQELAPPSDGGSVAGSHDLSVGAAALGSKRLAPELEFLKNLPPLTQPQLLGVRSAVRIDGETVQFNPNDMSRKSLQQPDDDGALEP